MRHYRIQTPAQRDARIDDRVARMEALGIPPRGLVQREPLSLVLHVDGQTFEVEGKPARRCNQFALTLNGEPIGVGGAEKAWREIQRRRSPLLGERNLR